MLDTKAEDQQTTFSNSNSAVKFSYRMARRIVIAVVGVLVVLTGVVMLVTPGPAIVVIPAGLAILSVEFAFARRWLKSLRKRISKSAQNQRIGKL